MSNVYLAGPFFNPPQLQLIMDLEMVLAKGPGTTFFSPRLQHGEKPKPITNEIQARDVFDENSRQMLKCDWMLAVADYLLPDKAALRLCEDNGSLPATRISGPLQLPDTGTVWEMGMAYALDIPVIMFTTKEQGKGKMNIMLSQSAAGVLYGMDDLRTFLKGGCDFENLNQWQGGYV